MLWSIDTTFRDLCSFQCHVIAQKCKNKRLLSSQNANCNEVMRYFKNFQYQNVNPHTTLAQYKNTHFITKL